MFSIIGWFPGTGELVLILGIALVVFGGSRLPEVGKGLGEAIRNFKQGVNNKPGEKAEESEEEEEKKEEEKKSK